MENNNNGLMMKVEKDKIMACMKCSICKDLRKQATTISVCLHTFCKDCIHEKLSEDDNDCCPVCEMHLGYNPLDKLRPDPNIQAIREKIFPSVSNEVEAPEITLTEALEITPAEAPEIILTEALEITPVEASEIAPVEASEMVPVEASEMAALVEAPGITTEEAPVVTPVEAPEITPAKTLPSKAKERLLSSLARSTPRVTRASLRKCSTLRIGSTAAEETPTKEGDSVDGTRSPETLNKIVQYKKRRSSGKSANDQNRQEQMENNVERREEADLSMPLNTLVEAGSSSKVARAVSEGPSDVNANLTINPENADASTRKIKGKEKVVRAKVKGEKRSMGSTSRSEKHKRIRRANKGKMGESSNSSDPNLMLQPARPHKRDIPLWFSLVASDDDQEGLEPLPQLSAAFIRIKDPTMPVSFLQKYLVQKLGLASAEEVQIMCYGQPVSAHLKLTSLMDMWLYTSPSHKKVRAFVGDSAEDSMMVLSYSRKVAAPAS